MASIVLKDFFQESADQFPPLLDQTSQQPPVVRRFRRRQRTYSNLLTSNAPPLPMNTMQMSTMQREPMSTMQREPMNAMRMNTMQRENETLSLSPNKQEAYSSSQVKM